MKFNVKVPATTANFGSGFDAVGMALKFYNELEIKTGYKNNTGNILTIEGEGRDKLPKNDKNIIIKSMAEACKCANRNPVSVLKGLEIKMINRIPLARGMGSSAAAIVSGLVAANHMLDNRLSSYDLLNIANRLEGHPDNVAPALFGGVCISVLDGSDVKCIKIRPPVELDFIVCVPQFELSTQKARKILPENVSLKNAVFNLSRASLLVGALAYRQYNLLSLATQDKLHQPFRRKLVPGMEEAFKKAVASGSLAVFLSGSGPTLMAIAEKKACKSKIIGQSMSKAFKSKNINSFVHVLSVDSIGAKVNA